MAEPIAWDLAERVAIRIAGTDAFARSYHYESLGPDFAELTAEAEELVARETGLRSLSGPARAEVTDRAGWVRANVASFRRLLRPVTDRLAPKLESTPLAPVSRTVAGVQLGTMLGWMATRVLGQYDVLLVADDDDAGSTHGDVVYYVGPNVIALEKRFGFPPREFRLWLALHEVTHRAQFTGVPWMQGYFHGLVDQSLAFVDPDPRRFIEGLRRAMDDVRAGRNPLDEGGLVALVAGPEQRAVLHKVQGLMSLLEGHGDVTMDRAGAEKIPSAERFSRVLRERRRAVSPLVRLLQQLIGLEAKMRQYELGERFIEAVEAEGGPELLERAWQGPEWLPTLAEIRDPALWISRAREPIAGPA